MTTIEKNILIAEFIGRRGKRNKNLFWYYDVRAGKGWHTAEDLMFHSSWDWLINVVEIIEDIKIEGKDTNVIIADNSCSIGYLDWLNSITEHKETKIEATYEAVINFIRWYNNDKVMNDIKNKFII